MKVYEDAIPIGEGEAIWSVGAFIQVEATSGLEQLSVATVL